CEYRLDTLDTLLEHYKESDGWEIYSNTGAIHPKAFDRPSGMPLMDDPAIAIRSKNKHGQVSNLALQYTAGLLFMFGVFNHDLDIT
ncbi:hypothetical protein, partial [Enterococcus faecium]